MHQQPSGSGALQPLSGLYLFHWSSISQHLFFVNRLLLGSNIFTKTLSNLFPLQLVQILVRQEGPDRHRVFYRKHFITFSKEMIWQANLHLYWSSLSPERLVIFLMFWNWVNPADVMDFFHVNSTLYNIKRLSCNSTISVRWLRYTPNRK